MKKDLDSRSINDDPFWRREMTVLKRVTHVMIASYFHDGACHLCGFADVVVSSNHHDLMSVCFALAGDSRFDVVRCHQIVCWRIARFYAFDTRRNFVFRSCWILLKERSLSMSQTSSCSLSSWISSSVMSFADLWDKYGKWKTKIMTYVRVAVSNSNRGSSSVGSSRKRPWRETSTWNLTTRSSWSMSSLTSSIHYAEMHEETTLVRFVTASRTGTGWNSWG